jgi:GTPase SAR1 family protein
MKLAICGNDGSGKTTLARKLIDFFNLPPDSRAPFGDAPRHWVSEKYGIPLEYLYQKPTPPEYRKLLIDTCLTMEREIGYEETRKKVFEFWKNSYGNRQHNVVDDCRFPYELATLKELGYKAIHISYPPTCDQNYGYYREIEQLARSCHYRTSFSEVRTTQGFYRIVNWLSE